MTYIYIFKGFGWTVVRISLLRTAVSAELPQRERRKPFTIFPYFLKKLMFIRLFYALTILSMTMFENNSHKTIKIDLF